MSWIDTKKAGERDYVVYVEASSKYPPTVNTKVGLNVTHYKGFEKMTEVKIPFLPEFQERMLKGDKTATTRSKKYGEAGDTFKKFGATFRIIIVLKLPLSAIAYAFYKNEGFKTRQGFIDIWKRLHPRRGYNPEDKKYIHFFLKTGER